MKYPVLSIAVLAFLLAPQFSLADRDTVLTLSTAIAKTLKKNPQFQQFEIKNQKMVNDRELAGYRPRFNVGLEVENFAGSGEFSGVDAAETTLALSSVIELGGQRHSRTQVMEARLSQFEVDRKIQTIDILGNLTLAFISSISTAEKIRLSKDSVVLFERALKSVKRRVDRGIANKADFMRAKAALAEERIKLDVLQGQLEIQKYILASFWGSTSFDFKSVSGDLYASKKVLTFNALYKKILASPAVESYASLARLQQAKIQLAQSSSRTNIEWQVGVRQFQATDDSAFIAGFSVPIFSGKRNQGRYKQAQLDLQTVEINKNKALVALHQSLFSAYTKRQQSIRSGKIIEDEIIPDLTAAEKLILKGYENGRYKYQDLISAQKELNAVKWMRIEHATTALLNQSIIEQLIAEPLSL